MIRPITKEDRDVYVSLADLFYHSEAVDHPVPPAYYKRTFEELMRSEDYLEGFLFEVDREPAGYVLLAKTFSQEAGGMVWWIEELFYCPNSGAMVWASSFSNGWRSAGPRKSSVCGWKWSGTIWAPSGSMDGRDTRRCPMSR